MGVDLQELGQHGVVCTELYNGQGLGNQLWAYVVTRIGALRTGQNFSILGQGNFKGAELFNLDFGVKLSKGLTFPGGPPLIMPKSIKTHVTEKKLLSIPDLVDVSGPDDQIMFPPISSKIDGNFQSYSYLSGYESEIREWLRIKIGSAPNQVRESCLIHFRAGDFASQKHLFLPSTYYEQAIEYIKQKDPHASFICVSDDPALAQKTLPNFVEVLDSEELFGQDPHKASHHAGGPIEFDFRMLLSAKHLIIPNSSFSWWAAFLNSHAQNIVAPKYWARFNANDGFWSTSDIQTPGFTYLDKDGVITDYGQLEVMPVGPASRVEGRRVNEAIFQEARGLIIRGLGKLAQNRR